MRSQERRRTGRGSGRRIALVSEHASPLAALGGADAGGQNVHVAALAEHLAARAIEVTVYTRRDDPDLPPRQRAPGGYDVVHVDAGPRSVVPKDHLLPFMAGFGRRLHEEWGGQHRPDLIHAHFWMSGLAARMAAVPLGIPLAQTFHALGIVKRRQQGAKDTSPAGRTEVETSLVRTVDQIVATCSDEVFELVRMGGDRRRITVVPCGVDLRHFQPSGPVAPRRGLRRVLVVGRLVERKGIGNVIAALSAVPDAEIVVAGGADAAHLATDADAVRLAAVARRHGVADRVDLRGRVGRDELPALIRSADLVVCAPWYEPFGIVPLEAMACGRPVLATAVGGLVDTVVDGVTGRHVPPRRPDLLANAMREMLDDPARGRAMGAAGRRRVEERYGWERVAAATSACYERVIGHAVAGAARREGSSW
jgi:D-inositol-3-phosphate glycosyltransferase